MTYCVAAAVAGGIAFASDSRTTAGVDDVAVFSKMHVFEVAGERVVVALSAGNLATSQSVVTLLRSRAAGGVHAAGNLYEVARLFGETLREVMQRDAPSLEPAKIDPGCDFLVGGQVKGEAPRLFHVYAQGNFIEATRETPYFQLGEVKYGKPILDRIVTSETPLDDAAKCLLVSFDATLRSDVSVGMPIDLLAYETDRLRVTRRKRMVEGDEYFGGMSRSWSASLRQAFAHLPDVNWRAGEY
jgi:putative proteasome-type protease